MFQHANRFWQPPGTVMSLKPQNRLMYNTLINVQFLLALRPCRAMVQCMHCKCICISAVHMHVVYVTVSSSPPCVWRLFKEL